MIVGYEYRQNGGTPVDVGNVTEYLVTGLDAETEYTFEVRAYDELGQFSAWSNEATETTMPALPGVFTADFDPATLVLSNNDPVSTWTDSIGAVAATGTTTTRPLFKTNIIGTLPALLFDGTDDFLDAGDNFDLLARSATVFVLAKKTSSDFAMFAKCDGSTVGGYAGIGSSPSYGGSFYNSGAGGQNDADLTGTDSDFALYEFRFNRSLGWVECYKDGVFQDRSTTFTPDEGTSRNVALTYKIGKFDVGLPLPFGGHIARLLHAFHNGKLGLNYVTQTYGYISSVYGTVIFNPSTIITCEGDSLTQGIPGTVANSWPSQLAGAIGANNFRVDTNLATRAYIGSVDKTADILIRNVARSGATLSDMTADAADQVDNEFNSDKTNILVFYGGINNFGLDSEATIEAAIQTYCEDRKTANPNLQICICTFADAVSYTTKVNNVNTWLRANYTDFADYIADLNGPLNDHTNLTYYDADGLHMTTAGYTIIAGIVQTALGL